MKTLLTAVIFCLVPTQFRAAEGNWEIVRPTIMLLLDGDVPYHGTAQQYREELRNVLRQAAIAISPDSTPEIRGDLESIVIVEKADEWLIAFYRKGNGRVARISDGNVEIQFPSRENPSVVTITRGGARVELSTRYLAAPVGIGGEELQIAADYLDETVIESRLKRASKSGPP